MATTTPGTAPAVNPDTRSLPGRRNILGDAIAGLAGAVILAGAGVAVATPETLASEPIADAELIAACERMIRLQDEWCLFPDDAPDEAHAEKQEQVVEEMAPLLDRLRDLRATTADAIVARVRALLHSNPTDAGGIHWHSFDYPTDYAGRQLAYIFRDAEALGGVA